MLIMMMLLLFVVDVHVDGVDVAVVVVVRHALIWSTTSVYWMFPAAFLRVRLLTARCVCRWFVWMCVRKMWQSSVVCVYGSCLCAHGLRFCVQKRFCVCPWFVVVCPYDLCLVSMVCVHVFMVFALFHEMCLRAHDVCPVLFGINRILGWNTPPSYPCLLYTSPSPRD